ncbi:MAG TPA: DnaJ domain-containing protein [Casimicrobiaceae bacterium]|nr:DnaJ domain-containing protein [Casimicrobiaceae bacterium]
MKGRSELPQGGSESHSGGKPGYPGRNGRERRACAVRLSEKSWCCPRRHERVRADGMDVADSKARDDSPETLTRDQETAVLYTHYDYLELPPGASSTRIEAAYHTLKQRLNGDADQMFLRLIHEAYAVLSDPDRRRFYDAVLQRGAADADAELKACLDQQAALWSRHAQDVPAPLIAAISAWAA